MHRASPYPAVPGTRAVRRAGSLAAAWALLFAAISLYWSLAASFDWTWAIDGFLGAYTVGNEIARPVEAGDRGFIATLWVSVIIKALLALIPLALVQSWGGLFSSWLRVAGCLVAGLLLALYGLINGIQHLAMITGMTTTPEGLGERAARWHLFLWDPFWLLGGLLFLATAWLARRARAWAR
jgi:hypothetical protein